MGRFLRDVSQTTTRKRANVVLRVNPQKGANDGLIQLVVHTPNGSGVAAGGELLIYCGPDYVAPSTTLEVTSPAKRFKGRLDVMLAEQQKMERMETSSLTSSSGDYRGDDDEGIPEGYKWLTETEWCTHYRKEHSRKLEEGTLTWVDIDLAYRFLCHDPTVSRTYHKDDPYILDFALLVPLGVEAAEIEAMARGYEAYEHLEDKRYEALQAQLGRLG